MPAQPIVSGDMLPIDPPAAPPAHPGRAEPLVLDGVLPLDLEFEPVPRRARSNGLTPDRQRRFIQGLAQCGSATTAARAIGASTHALYELRNGPAAESFGAAWDKAVERGARRVLDVLIDHAVNGTPEYIYKDGQLVAERRHFNTRAMMWIVAHTWPDRFGVTGGLMHSASGPIGLKRLKAAWKKEWEEERRALEASREDPRDILRRKLDGMHNNLMAGYARDPEKREAYERLHGPQAWSKWE